MDTRKPWSPHSWQGLPIAQQPSYEDPEALELILKKIRHYPPLVFAGEVVALKRQLAAAAEGKRFLLQGGDCAERFEDCNPQAITNKLNILLQMSIVLCYGTRKPIIRVGRIAGQYGKPRSQTLEVIGHETLPVYRGDNVNSHEPLLAKRKADPHRLLQGYHLASMTLNYIRALTAGGFADLHHPDNWKLDFAGEFPHQAHYDEIIYSVKNAIQFMESIGYCDPLLSRVDFYTSHEGLILALESALTRYHASHRCFYNLGAHMLWIGDRTRALHGAHIEYFRGIANPIGIKIGPSSDPQEIKELVEILNPSQEAGRITLITRFGEHQVSRCLPPLLEALQALPFKLCWSCDPMHGNAIKTKDNVKTRDFNAILSELTTTVQIHRQCGSHLAGVHFELSGENVTECIGGAEGITVSDLSKSYHSLCDPRLNYSQSLEMAFQLASMLDSTTAS